MAELELNCPHCSATVSVPIVADATEYACTACGRRSPIHEAYDLVGELKDPLIGATVSECEIQQKVGEGGFGAVYRAFDKNLRRPVALKVMLQSLTSNLEFVQKFIREAVTAAQLNHPNIVAIHKVGRDEERNLHFLIMEYLEGRTLADIIEERGALPLDESISVILQCSDALAVAQDKNIIHRDIKPENIMVDPHGIVKITDFGLAKTLTTDMKSTKVVGTPHYMSPEQFEGKAVDGRTDIYSLGVTFYYMLTRAKPYQGTNTVQIIYSILTQDPRPVMDVNADLPEEIWTIVRKMIAKDVGQRYQDFRQVRRDLLAFQERSLAQRVTCPQCEAVNVRGRKFCRECGASLLVRCPECGHEDAAGSRRCAGCGVDLERLQSIRENLERGQKLRSFGDLKRALTFYQEVLKLDPEHAGASEATREIRLVLETIEERKAEVDSLVERGEPEKALERVESLLGEFPSDEELKTYGHTIRRGLILRAVDAHLLVAEKALEEGRLEDAMAAYESALRADPSRKDIEQKLGDLRDRAARIADTFDAARRALEEGRHTDALQSAAEVLKLRPRDEEARRIHDEAREKVESIESFVHEARELLQAKAYEDAISRLETALDISPGDDSVRALLDDVRRRKSALDDKISLARRLLADGKPGEALTGLEEALAERPDLAAAVSLREEAVAAVDREARAREIDDLVEEAIEAERRGEMGSALGVYERILEREPEHTRATNLKKKVEAKIEEVIHLRRIADEHLEAGAFAQALAALNRVRNILPDDRDLAREAEEVQGKLDRVDAALRRTADALKRKRFDLAQKAADEVLALAPQNGQALAAKRESVRGQAAIDKHLDEARGLIESELFDDAIAELNKALERGAPPPAVAQLRQAADEGKINLLKSEATRSFVFKDFASAIDLYERVLKVEADDSDARKGIRLAERRMRAREREGIVTKVILGAALVVLLAVVQFRAVGESGTIIEIPTAAAGVKPPPPPPPEKPDLDGPLSLEAGTEVDGDWSSIEARFADGVESFPEEKLLVEGRAFARAMVEAAAFAREDPASRLAALRKARAAAGTIPRLRDRREALIDLEIRDTVFAWVERTGERAGRDWPRAAEDYAEILEDPAVKGTSLAEDVRTYQQFAFRMVLGEEVRRENRFADACQAYDLAARDAGEDAARREMALALRGEAETAWIEEVRVRVRQGGMPSDEFYGQVIEELARMVQVLGLGREEILRRVEGD